MILLRLISWPYVRKHLLRSLLTMAGIMLGVAVFVGMHTANQSVLFAFQRTVNRIAGAAQLQVTAADAGFPEEVLEVVQSAPGVRVAVPVIEAVVDSGIPGQGNLLILAVDMTGDRSLRDYDFETADEAVIEDPLVFLAQPDSLIITREFAERNGLEIDSRLPLLTMDGQKNFTVRGVMRSGGMTSAFGGNLAIMDIYAAQKVFGRGRMFDRIDLGVKEGVSVEQCQATLRKILGPGYQVEPPQARGQQFEAILRIYAFSVSISSLFALFIGMFIIYNSFAIAVTQRRSEVGILRALGATRAQIRNLFLAESAVGGLIGSLAGLAFGNLLARGIATQISGMFEVVYGVSQRAEEIASDPLLIAGALVIGVVTSIVAAFIPARNAARVDPVRALQKGKYQVLSAGENRVRRILALILGAASVALLLRSSASWMFYAGYLLMVMAAVLLTPTLALLLTRWLRPALRWIRPVEGALAADSLIQAPRRTSATVAALMLSLAMVIGLAGVARASYGSILDWIQSHLNPDLFVTTSENLSDRSFRFPLSMGDELRSMEGIGDIQSVRTARVPFRGGPVMIVSTEIEILARRVRGQIVSGDAAEMNRRAAAGSGLIVSENLTSLHHLRLGDPLDIAAPGGLLRLPIVGITRDYSDQQGSILMDRAVYARYWNDETVNVFRVYLKAGASADDVKRRILERYAGHRRLFVLANQQVRDDIMRIADQWFGLSYVQIAVAVLIGILGIVNTLTVSITDRRRELGVLQAVGGLRRQVRRTVWMEAVTIGLLALILGLGLGAINLFYTLEMTRQVGGLVLDYQYPTGIALFLLPTILAVAFASALGPAESAVRGSLVEALEYE